jgi:fatty acid synthase subunit alpha
VLPQRTHLSTRPASLSHFTTAPLSDIDIHSLVASYEHEPRKKVLSAFYTARAALVEYDVEGTLKLATPSLLEALSGHASIFALFGGQGINEIYFDELQTLFDTYRPLVEPFLALHHRRGPSVTCLRLPGYLSTSTA